MATYNNHPSPPQGASMKPTLTLLTPLTLIALVNFSEATTIREE